jgi:PAS domain-containing protein
MSKGTKVAKKKGEIESSGIVSIFSFTRDINDMALDKYMRQAKENASPDIKMLLKRITELEELYKDLMGMVENSYDGLAIVDGDSRLLLLNPSFERVMGLSNKEIIGKR